ncbi:hypothetical protein AB0C38_31910 [Amycolatopsis sp. NPDC048633]|uniref:hypothetical protein n=1 Tax=Amycolatopsis sp. NPDC048633 TaxID=3157095 RepID=UPI00340553AD
MKDFIFSWWDLALGLLVFGFAPGLVLRVVVLIYPKDDPRRRELLAELYAVKRLEQPFFVAQQLETVLFEGVPHRVKAFFSWLYNTSDPDRMIWRVQNIVAPGLLAVAGADALSDLTKTPWLSASALPATIVMTIIVPIMVIGHVRWLRAGGRRKRRGKQ